MEQSLVRWAEELPHAETQLMLLRAAKTHDEHFTNADEIGMSWNKVLREQGYEYLCPYARNYMAQQYLQVS